MAMRMRGSVRDWIELDRARKDAARFLAHHPVIGEHERLTLSRQTLRRRPKQPNCLTVSIGRVLIALPAHINGSDHVPPLPLLGMLAQPRFDAGDESFEILVVGGIFKASRERLVGKARRAIEEIESERQQRYHGGDDNHRRSRPTCRDLLATGGALLAVGLQQPSRDLEPRRLGLALADQPAPAVRIDLAQLIAIDGGVERLARVRPRSRAE